MAKRRKRRDPNQFRLRTSVVGVGVWMEEGTFTEGKEKKKTDRRTVSTKPIKIAQ